MLLGAVAADRSIRAPRRDGNAEPGDPHSLSFAHQARASARREIRADSDDLVVGSHRDGAPGGLAMAVAVASVEDVEEGHLPSVCAKTGRPADGFTTLEFASAPGWTWILLLFGIFPFLIAQHFATRRIYARIPMSDLALRRIYAFKWTYRIFFVAAAFLLAIGWLLSEDHGPTCLLIGVITLGVTLAFWALGGLLVFPTGRVGDEFVTMSFVDKRFADEVDRWYGD
jgi:hypothetical protein